MSTMNSYGGMGGGYGSYGGMGAGMGMGMGGYGGYGQMGAMGGMGPYGPMSLFTQGIDRFGRASMILNMTSQAMFMAVNGGQTVPASPASPL